MRILLWALQSPINIGMILRTAEIYAIETGVYDRHDVLADRGAAATISDFACGALQRRPPCIFREADAARGFAAGARWVASTVSGKAVAVDAFAFAANDCLVVGNEYDGLPEELLDGTQARVTIPMPAGYLPKPRSHSPIDPSHSSGAHNDGVPNLNVAVAGSILMYVAHTQLARAARPT